MAEEQTNINNTSNDNNKSNNTTSSCSSSTKRGMNEEATATESKKRRKQEKLDEHLKRRKEKKEKKKGDVREDALNEGVVSQQDLQEAHYVFSDGLRRVEPYYFYFRVHAKERWQEQPILDLFTTEFSHLPRHVYEAKIIRGDITINNKMVNTDTKISAKDLLTHKVHRHEPPVSPHPIKIVTQTDEIVVIDKPPSIPVHPCGRYRHNSVLFILAHEMGLNRLYNRLDRLTSGLLLFARNPAIAKRYSAEIFSGKVHKQYIARVVGEFPDSGEVVVDAPIKVVNHRLGINTVHPEGKPITGRTHQIRVHLQHLGYPITNDPLYNNDPAVNKLGIYTSDGIALSKLTSLMDDDGEDIFESTLETKDANTPQNSATLPTNTNMPTSIPDTSTTTANTTHTTDTTGKTNTTATTDTTNTTDKTNTTEATHTTNIDPECPDCQHPKSDPLPQNMCLYLHAFIYEGPNWKFETELPDWAK